MSFALLIENFERCSLMVSAESKIQKDGVSRTDFETMPVYTKAAHHVAWAQAAPLI